jgi:hypothetical protein
MRRASASTNGNPATMRRLWAADIEWARITFLAPERPVSRRRASCIAIGGQYRHELKAKGAGWKGSFCKTLIQSELSILPRANGGEKWAMYRPYAANKLTNGAEIVNVLAKTDHNFGCRKFHCTVQNSKSAYGWCESERRDLALARAVSLGTKRALCHG